MSNIPNNITSNIPSNITTHEPASEFVTTLVKYAGETPSLFGQWFETMSQSATTAWQNFTIVGGQYTTWFWQQGQAASANLSLENFYAALGQVRTSLEAGATNFDEMLDTYFPHPLLRAAAVTSLAVMGTVSFTYGTFYALSRLQKNPTQPEGGESALAAAVDNARAMVPPEPEPGAETSTDATVSPETSEAIADQVASTPVGNQANLASTEPVVVNLDELPSSAATEAKIKKAEPLMKPGFLLIKALKDDIQKQLDQQQKNEAALEDARKNGRNIPTKSV